MRPGLRYAKAVVTWVVRLGLIALLCLILAGAAILIVIPRATHGVALTVLTGSMTPGIPVGSVVIDRPVDTRTLHVGDIATYQKAPGVDEYITHRIVKINTKTTPTTFTFKGDANRGPDIKPVPADAIRGEVWFHVPYLGGIRDSLKASLGRTLLIAVVALALGGYAVKQFTSEIRDRRRRRNGTDGTDTLAMRFELRAFGDVDPSFVADLLQGECTVIDDSFLLTFSGDAERMDVLRSLLAPYGVEDPPGGSAEEDAGETVDTADDCVDHVAAGGPVGVSLDKSVAENREPAHA